MKTYLLCLLIASTTLPCSAQTHRFQNKDDLFKILDVCMTRVCKQEFEAAFDSLKPYSSLRDEQMDTLALTMKAQWANFLPVLGKPLGYEKASDKEVKNTVMQILYIVKLEKMFLRYIFTAYNNGNGWAIVKFDYDDKVDGLF